MKTELVTIVDSKIYHKNDPCNNHKCDGKMCTGLCFKAELYRKQYKIKEVDND